MPWGHDDRCVCGCPMHVGMMCHCGCSIAELDDGTDHSPTHTGNTYAFGVFGYTGIYNQTYANSIGARESDTW